MKDWTKMAAQIADQAKSMEKRYDASPVGRSKKAVHLVKASCQDIVVQFNAHLKVPGFRLELYESSSTCFWIRRKDRTFRYMTVSSGTDKKGQAVIETLVSGTGLRMVIAGTHEVSHEGEIQIRDQSTGLFVTPAEFADSICENFAQFHLIPPVA